MDHVHYPHIFRLFVATVTLVVFTILAAVVIVAWISAVPEAFAVEIGQSQVQAPYLAWHQSWHYSAAWYDSLSQLDCAK